MRPHRELPPKDWATTGKHGRSHPNFVTSLFIDPNDCDEMNQRLARKYALITEKEIRYEAKDCEDAEVVLVAYGTPARVVLSAIEELRRQGVKAGLFRPITLWPFPEKQLHDLAGEDHVKVVVDVEMSLGQMIDDVRLAVEGQKPVKFAGVAGGLIPTVEDIVEAAKNALKEAE